MHSNTANKPLRSFSQSAPLRGRYSTVITFQPIG